MKVITDLYNAPMDYVGQDIAYKIQLVVLSVGALVGYVIGWMRADFALTFYIMLGFGVVTCLAVVPSWPFFRSHPVKWQPSGDKESEDTSNESSPRGSPSPKSDGGAGKEGTGQNVKKRVQPKNES